MKAIIVGCGRVGASMAETLDRAGHQVIILDISTRAFDRLPSSFAGEAVRGDGTDEDVLRRAGAEDADLFVALTEGDNRNIMAAQLAIEALSASRVIAKINDPVRATAYAELGIATLCRTGLMMDAIGGFLGWPASGLPGILEPLGTHPGGEHHDDDPADLPLADAGVTAGPPVGSQFAGPSGAGGGTATRQEA